MKVRQAIKICNNIKVSNLEGTWYGAYHVSGLKNVNYTYSQFKTAFRTVRKAYKHYYK